MFRFIYVIMMNVFRAPYMIPKMRYMAQHPEKYAVIEEETTGESAKKRED